MSEFTNVSNFTLLGEKVAILKGKVGGYELINLANFLKVAATSEGRFVLLIDSEGGLADPELIYLMLKAPIHTHVLKKAHSFGAALFLGGSYKTISEEATFMIHKPFWDENYLSESIHQDDTILNKHIIKGINLLSSILPCNEGKKEIIEAYLNKQDTFFNVDWLYDQAIIDEVGDLNFEELDLYSGNLKWLKRNYSKVTK